MRSGLQAQLAQPAEVGVVGAALEHDQVVGAGQEVVVREPVEVGPAVLAPCRVTGAPESIDVGNPTHSVGDRPHLHRLAGKRSGTGDQAVAEE